MEEPWYESQGPSIKGVINIILNKICNNLTPVTDKKREIVTKIVTKHYENSAPGSYRGYYTWDHRKIMDSVNTALNKKDNNESS